MLQSGRPWTSLFTVLSYFGLDCLVTIMTQKYAQVPSQDPQSQVPKFPRGSRRNHTSEEKKHHVLFFLLGFPGTIFGEPFNLSPSVGQSHNSNLPPSYSRFLVDQNKTKLEVLCCCVFFLSLCFGSVNILLARHTPHCRPRHRFYTRTMFDIRGNGNRTRARE